MNARSYTFGPTEELPFWVDPPNESERSIDPLGYSETSDGIADRLLPGVTVQTRRARYLSALCWAVQRCGNNPEQIDRFEVALSISEFKRHGMSVDCSFLGKLLLSNRQYQDKQSLPRRLHSQSARVLYSGLARSCGLIDNEWTLSPLGVKLADCFGKGAPKSLPNTVRQCWGMPCLSKIGSVERRYLRKALFDATPDGEVRLRTFKAVGARGWRTVQRKSHKTLLASFLAKPNPSAGGAAKMLHEAAVFELEALPATRLFLALYQDRTFHGSIPMKSAFRAFDVGSKTQLLSDLGAHLRRARSLGRVSELVVGPLKFKCIKDEILHRHREVAKTDEPWVDENWTVLRPGLYPRQLPDVHAYRLSAFTSLLADLEEI